MCFSYQAVNNIELIATIFNIFEFFNFYDVEKRKASFIICEFIKKISF